MSHQQSSNSSQVYESSMEMARRAKQNEEAILTSVRVENIMKSMMTINMEVDVRKKDMFQIEEILKEVFKNSHMIEAIKTQMFINDRANFHYQAGILFVRDNKKLNKLCSNWEELAKLGKFYFADLRVKFETWDGIYRFLKAASINVGLSCNSWKESFAVDETFKKSSDSLFNKIGLFRKLKAEYVVLDDAMKTYSQDVRNMVEMANYSAKEELKHNENIKHMLKKACMGQMYFYQMHGDIFQQHAYTDRIATAAREIMSILNATMSKVSNCKTLIDDFNIAILLLAEKINFLCGVVFSLANVNKDIRTHFRHRNQIIESSDYFEFKVPGLPISDSIKIHITSREPVKTNERAKEKSKKREKMTPKRKERLIELSNRIPITQAIINHIEDTPIPESESYLDGSAEEDLEIEECNFEEFIYKQILNERAHDITCEEKERNSKETTGAIVEDNTGGEAQQDASLVTLDSKNENTPINNQLDFISKDSSNETLKTTFKNICIAETDKKESSLASGEILNNTSYMCKETEISSQKDDEKTTQAVGNKKVTVVATDIQKNLKEPLKKIAMNESLPKVKKSRRKYTPMKLTKGKHTTRRELSPMKTQSDISELHLKKRTSVKVDTDKTLSKDGLKLPNDLRANEMAPQIHQISPTEIPLGRDKQDEQSDAKEENKICPPDVDGELPVHNFTDVVKTSPISEITNYKKDSAEKKCADTFLPKAKMYGSSDANIVTRSKNKQSRDSEFNRGRRVRTSNTESISQTIASEPALPSMSEKEECNCMKKAGGEAQRAASSMAHNSVTVVQNSFVSELHNLKEFLAQYYKETGLEERDIHRRAGRQTMFESIEYAVQYSLNLIDKLIIEEPDSIPEEFEELKPTLKNRCTKESNKKDTSLASCEIQNKTAQNLDEKTIKTLGNKKESVVASDNQRTSEEHLKKITINESLPKKCTTKKLTKGKHNKSTESEPKLSSILLLPKKKSAPGHQSTLTKSTQECVVSNKSKQQLEIVNSSSKGVDQEQPHQEEFNENPNTECVKTSKFAEKTISSKKRALRKVLRKQDIKDIPSAVEDVEIKEYNAEEILSKQRLNESAEATACGEEERNFKQKTGSISEVKTIGEVHQDANLMTLVSKNYNIPTNKEPDLKSKDSYNETIKTIFKNLCIEESDKKEIFLESGEFLNNTSCRSKEAEISEEKNDEKTIKAVGNKKESLFATVIQNTLKEPLKKITISESLAEVRKCRRKCTPMKQTKAKHNTRDLFPMETQSEVPEMRLEKRTSVKIDTGKILSKDNFKLPDDKMANQMGTEIHQMCPIKIPLWSDKHDEQSNTRDEKKICLPDVDGELPIHNFTAENSIHVVKISPISEITNYEKESGEKKCADTSFPKATTYSSSDANIVNKSRNKQSHDSEFNRGMSENTSNVETFSQTIANEPALPSIFGKEESNSKENTQAISKVKTALEALQALSSMTHNSLTEVRNSFVTQLHNLKGVLAEYYKEEEIDMHGRGGRQTMFQSIEYNIQNSLDFIDKIPVEELDSIPEDFEMYKAIMKNGCIEESDKKQSYLASWEIENTISSVIQETEISAQNHDENTKHAIGNKKVNAVATDNEITSEKHLKKIPINESLPKGKKCTSMKLKRGKYNKSTESEPDLSSTLILPKIKSSLGHQSTLTKSTQKCMGTNKPKQQPEIVNSSSKGVDQEQPHEEPVNENSNIECVTISNFAEKTMSSREGAIRKVPRKQEIKHDPSAEEDFEIEECNVDESLTKQRPNECAEVTTFGEEERNSKQTTGAILELKTVSEAQQDVSLMSLDSKNENIPINKDLHLISKDACNETSVVATDIQLPLKEPLKKITMNEPLPKVKKSRRKCTPMKLTKGKHNTRRVLYPIECPSEILELHLKKRTSVELDTDKTLSKNDFKLPIDMRANKMSPIKIPLGRDKHDELSDARDGNKICPPDLDGERPIHNCTDENCRHVMTTSLISEINYKNESAEQKFANTSLPKSTTYGSSDANTVNRSRNNRSLDSESNRGMPDHTSNAERISQTIASEPALPSMCGKEENNSKVQTPAISKVKTVLEALQAVSIMTHNSLTEFRNSFVSELHNLKGALAQYHKEEERDMHRGARSQTMFESIEYEIQNSLNFIDKIPIEELDSIPEDFEMFKTTLKNRCIEQSDKKESYLASSEIEKKNSFIIKGTEISAQNHGEMTKQAVDNKKESVVATDNQKISEEHLKKITINESLPKIKKCTTMKLTKGKHKKSTEIEPDLSSTLMLPKIKSALGHQSTLTKSTKGCVASNNSKQQSEVINSSSNAVDLGQAHEETVIKNPNTECVSTSNLAEKTMSSSKGAIRKVQRNRDIKKDPDNECVISNNSMATENSVGKPERREQQNCVRTFNLETTTYGSSGTNILTKSTNKRSHDSAVKRGIPEYTPNAESVSQTTASEPGLSSILLLPKIKPSLGHQSTLTNSTQECVASNNSKQQSKITNTSSKSVNREQLYDEAINDYPNTERVTSSNSNLAAEETMNNSKGARKKVPCKQEVKNNPEEECMKSHYSMATVISLDNPKDAKQEGVKLCKYGVEENSNEERSSSTLSRLIGDKNKDFSITECFLNDKSFEVAEVLSNFERVNLEIEKVLACLKKKRNI